MIQRYMALKDVKAARRGHFIYVIGAVVMIFLCMYNGLLLYATYHDCDPLTTKLAKAKDQMVPLLVMEILKDMPGLPGLFIAGVFSAALSSLSTSLNSMSAVVLEDYCKPFMQNEISERASSFIMRGTVLVLGVVSVALVYVVQHLGSVLQLSMSLPTACFGPLLGLFFVGLTLPWIGKRAVLYGAIIGVGSLSVIVFTAQAEMMMGQVRPQYKPLSVEGCTYNFTSAVGSSTPLNTSFIVENDQNKTFFQISYLYYTLLGSTIVTVSSFILSFVFGFQDPAEVDPRLLAPFLRKFWRHENQMKRVMEEESYELTLTADRGPGK